MALITERTLEVRYKDCLVSAYFKMPYNACLPGAFNGAIGPLITADGTNLLFPLDAIKFVKIYDRSTEQ